jgi:hypothetical protein
MRLAAAPTGKGSSAMKNARKEQAAALPCREGEENPAPGPLGKP